MSFYLLPMINEVLNTFRSSSANIYSGFQLNKILLFLTMPFTSQIFLNEKIIYTGFLTKLNSLNGYVHYLYVPCLIICILKFNKFNFREKFIIFYPIFFLFLAWLNHFIPILGLLQYYTKTTGWWRSYPILVLMIALSIPIVLNKLKYNNFDLNKKLITYLSKLIFILIISITIFLALLMLIFFLYKLGYSENIIQILNIFTNRSSFIISNYLDSYYFSNNIFFIICIFIFSNIITLSLFNYFIIKKIYLNNNFFTYFLFLSILISQYLLNQLYYPFNNGVYVSNNIKETQFLKDNHNPDNLIAIIYNDVNLVEKLVVEKHNFINNEPNLDLSIKLLEYPEFNRFQSNNTMWGAYFSSLDIPVYTKGTNFTSKRLNSFHKFLIKDDSIKLKIFNKGQTYLRVGLKSIDSQLLDVAGIEYLLSSIKINNSKFKLVYSGDYYNIYKNLTFSEKIFFPSKVYKIDNYLERLNFLNSGNIDINKEIVVENENLLISNDNIEDWKINKIRKDNFIKVITKTNGEGILFLRENHHPGWSAEINGKKTNIYRANHLFMAIKIPTGENKIIFKFKPPFIKIGTILTSISIILIFLIIFLNFKYVRNYLTKKESIS